MTLTNYLKLPNITVRPSPRSYEDMARKLHDSIIDSNWADTNRLVLDEPFWRDVYSDLKIESMRAPKGFGKSKEWHDIEELMKLMYRCEGMRDYINQILELLARDAHCAPATEPNVIMEDTLLELIENWREICVHPKYAGKIDESIGKGIRLLRQRYRFDWPDEHKAYY